MFPRDHWYAIVDARELRRGKVIGARRLGVELAVWRDEDGQVHATADRCPHRGASLSRGKVRGGCVECPFHGFRFDGAGRCVEAPCEGEAVPRHLDVEAHVVREAHDFIWLWWGEPREQYPEIPWFPELDGAYVHAGRVALTTSLHWTRAIENQLDWAHLPFVHGTTIGMGMPRAMRVGSEMHGDRLDTWLASQVRPDGTPELKISLIFPNIWVNPFGGRWQTGMIAFVPIDEGHTLIYVRTYQRRLPIPGLAQLVSRVSNAFNRVILAQDLRVVKWQPQASTHDQKGERLVQSDLPIAQFRKHLRGRLGGRLPVLAAPDPAAPGDAVTDTSPVRDM